METTLRAPFKTQPGRSQTLDLPGIVEVLLGTLIPTAEGVIDPPGFPRAVICDCWEAGFCGRGRMPAAVGLRPDWDARRVRAAAREVEDAD
jgi:hypothetical protein